MATFNNSHHESGGVVLFSGELILLFCDNVNLQISERNHNETGRLYLTTHRMVFTNKSMKSSLKSFSAPFYSMHDLSLEQPIFGANYIKGKLNEEGNQNQVTFKLKFNSGGAIEYGQALQNAARMTRQAAQQTAFQPPPPYTPSASQYYQAPPTVYQPAYNCGFALPTEIFNQPPPAGFIYTSEAPPPYPGLNGAAPVNNGYPANAPYSAPSVPQAAPQQQPGFQNWVQGAPQPTPYYPGSEPSASAYPYPNMPTTYPQMQSNNFYPNANAPPPPYGEENKKAV